MRHNEKRGLKIGTDTAHTKAMKRNLVTSLFLNDRIKTTEARAKAIRGDVDRIITWAKRGDLHSRRLAIAKLNNKEIVREIFEKVEQGMWADRTCGFTRIMKLGTRKGDNASMVIIELVTEPCVPKVKAAKVVPEAVAAPVAQPVEVPAEEPVEAPAEAPADEVLAEEAPAVEEKAEEEAE